MAATTLTAGTGPDSLVLKISQDAYQGSAQYTVAVDGKQVGGTFTAAASHAAGQSDTLTLKGDWAAGAHKVSVKFLNDAYGGSEDTDRNLYVDAATYNGKAVAGAAQVVFDDWTPGAFSFTDVASTTTTPGGKPVALSAGTGSDTLVLKISQSAYKGDAQYKVFVDGEQIGGTFTASAAHAAKQSDTLTLKGDWDAGAHKVEVRFLNDAYGGTAATDRNLYVDSATYNGEAVAGAKLTLGSTGTKAFSFTEAAPPQTEFRESFFEGFDGTALDRSKWTITYGGDQIYWNGAFRWNNSELSVSDGALHIGMSNQADGIWTTSGLSTTPTSWGPGYAFTYGKVEIRAKTSQEVDGAGPCFLLWPAGNDHWPPEVDILETPHNQGMFTNHWAGPNGEDVYESTQFDLDHSQWHVYGLEWTPDHLTMTIDGKAVKTYTGHIPNEPMTVGLQGHVGAPGDWYGNPNGSGVNHVDIAVDYVRVSEYSPMG